jgi:PWWP domain
LPIASSTIHISTIKNPSFVSIALHLRDYFNNLWQEYLLPSDPPASSPATEHRAAYEIHQAAFEKRDEERRKRLENSGVLVLSKTFTTKASKLLLEFIENGGCVDSLDTTPLFGPNATDPGDPEVDLVIQRLGQYHAQLQEISNAASLEYTLDTFHKDLANCYTEHVLEDNPSLRNRFRCRLDRFFWKQAVPLHEANSRGVTQSSIWGNLAATIWARESSKKPYWPALCLGILPPAEQREGWHQAVTERNESRLPEKLRTQLMIAKKRCEQAQKRQSLSYFLVEFLGTHEFIWVRETDIIENFDPNSDPNKNASAVKKSRSTSSVVGSKVYATALQECVWASEEYENVLQDAFENAAAPDNEEEDDMNFSYHTLAQSDDEADSEGKRGYQYESDALDLSDVEEANYLIAHDGILDSFSAGRKNSKKRSQTVKKQGTGKSLPTKDDPSKKKRSRPAVKKEDEGDDGDEDDDDANVPEAVVVQDERGDQRDLEQRRKQRMRDHEKTDRSDARKKPKRRRSISNEEGDSKLLALDKQTRAAVIVKAYMDRLARQSDYKSLALSGVLTMPSSSVDSFGLLGLSLAFRAASGFLHMPDATKEELAKLKPWVVIDTETQKTSLERVQQIKKKIELLKKEIENVQSDTERRKRLVSEYVARRDEKELLLEADDAAARFNHFKKRKRSTPSKNDDRSDNDSPDGKMSVEGTPEAFEDEVEDMSKEHSDVDADVDEPVLVASKESPGTEEHSDEGDSD